MHFFFFLSFFLSRPQVLKRVGKGWEVWGGAKIGAHVDGAFERDKEESFGKSSGDHTKS